MRESSVNSAVAQCEAMAPVSAVRRSFEERSPIQSPDLQELRAAALGADAAGNRGEPGRIWRDLVGGKLALVDVLYTAERWLLVLEEAASIGDEHAVSERSRSLLEPLLLGKSQKRTAFDCGVAPSTLSMQAHRALGVMGFPLTPRKAPGMLALLARGASGLGVPPIRTAWFTHSSRRLLVASARRPELQLVQKLPSAEYRVLCGIVEGESYAEIAGSRGRSARTVANQVASIFHRLGVSGRGELISFLVTPHPFSEAEPSGRRSDAMASKNSLFPEGASTATAANCPEPIEAGR